MAGKKLQHFKNIDALRFFAFLKVYLHHLPIACSTWWLSQIKSGGGIGVLLFFVLSGFLITWILTKEKLIHHKINALNFIIRRILRIWPVYYLVLAFIFFTPYHILQHLGLVFGGYRPNALYSISFMENYLMLQMDTLPGISPLTVFWSLCIEEHFYIFWLLSFSLLPKKILPYFLFSCFPLAIFFRWIEPSIWQNQNIFTNDLFTNLDLFAAGGLLGYYTAAKPDNINYFFNKTPNKAQWVYIAIVLLLVFFHANILPESAFGKLNILKNTVFAITFSGLIAVLISKNSVVSFSNNGVLSFLGELSYGMYVYHLIFILLALKLCEEQNLNLNSFTTKILFIISTFSLTVLLSYLSKTFFENNFLKLKKFFQ